MEILEYLRPAAILIVIGLFTGIISAIGLVSVDVEEKDRCYTETEVCLGVASGECTGLNFSFEYSPGSCSTSTSEDLASVCRAYYNEKCGNSSVQSPEPLGRTCETWSGVLEIDSTCQ